jgi:hypothetical protein
MTASRTTPLAGSTATARTSHPGIPRADGTAGRRPRMIGLRPEILAWAGLVVLLAAGASFLFVETRGATFWFDEWDWVLERRANSLDAFLEPHNGHLSLVPISLYRLLLATFPLDVYGPYRLMVTAAHLGCVVLVWVYANRRVGGFLALLAAALILFLGPAWTDILWPFQVGWLIALGAGLAALLKLDRGDRGGDFSASALLAISVASSGVGLAIAFGMAVDILLRRRRWRNAWVVAVPLGLYGLWWLTYQDATILGTLIDAPDAVVDAASASISALLGLGGNTVPRSAGTLLEWGPPLAALAVVFFIWRVVRLGGIPPRVLALLAIVVAFWIATEWSRGPLATPYESRYLYVGGVFTLLIAIELARGVSVSTPVKVLLGMAVTAAVVSNVGTLRDAGEYIRSQSQVTRAVLGAVEAGRPLVDAHYEVSAIPGYPFVQIEAGSYFAATRGGGGGTPAAAVDALPLQSVDARRQVDREIFGIHRIALEPSSADLRLGRRPVVDQTIAGETVADGGACIAFRPAAASPASDTPVLRVTVPPEGALLEAEGGAVEVSLRRFADEFYDLGRLAPSVRAALRVRPDLSSQPWRLQIEPVEGATVCGLA